MKKRLDVVLCERGFYNSREKAKQAIEMGRVKLDERIFSKPAEQVEETLEFECLPFEFVSRGGFKLQKAIEEFGLDLKGAVVLDIGASTGGFSDVCLQNGAKKIYAVDTGENQLAEKIKSDGRVVNLEKTNYLDLDKSVFEDASVVVIDVSFVSLTKLIKKLSSDFENVKIIALIKPQFECGLEYAKKHKGIVKDPKMHKQIIDKIRCEFELHGFVVHGIIESPILGGDGNKEFLIFAGK